ncbi:MAG: IclR family transcriptional regulator [bacterium]|nr:IclR family transcriptional regulator [bacterium]
MNSSIKKAFEVLAFIAENTEKMSLAEMGSRLGMNKTTLYRFVATLESLELLEKRDDRYVPGIKLFQLGSKVPIKPLMVDKVHPILIRLTAEVNETVNMGEFHKNQVLYLDKTESQRSLQIHTSVGGYIAIHASALGKSILAILPEDAREAIISRLDFQQKTGHTVTDAGTLRAHVEKARQLGYSTDDEEWEEGLRCVAVPVLIEPVNFYGAISCSGPTVRFTPRRIEELAQNLKEAVKEIRNLF